MFLKGIDMNGNKIYLCIDLKSFYASVECVERGWDPLTARLVVADPERSEKTICLAVSPALKQMGVPNRCRVFQIPKEIPYKMAPPRMQLYIDYAAEIYGVYLKYIAKEDIQVYSIDEAFLDVADYLHLYQMTAVELGRRKAVIEPGLVVPQGYQNQLQFLLPICLTDMEKPNLAMTLAERNGYYLGSTCLTLEMAYLNARMIARPIAPWLTSLVKK